MNSMPTHRRSSRVRAQALGFLAGIACLAAVSFGVALGPTSHNGVRAADAAGTVSPLTTASTIDSPFGEEGSLTPTTHHHEVAVPTTAPGTAPATAPPTTAHAHVHTTAPAPAHVHPSGNPSPAPPPSPGATNPPAGSNPNGIVGVFCNGWIHRKAPSPHMVVDDRTGGRAPTAQDCANARAFYNAVVAANSKYADINVALAANFRPGGDPPGQYGQHYVQWGPSPGIADPNHPEGLVYHFDSSGHATLLGVMFVEQSNNLPQPGGPITVWHHHHTGNAGHMLHVWFFPGVQDPFALMISSAT
jgi:hypothetical protein